MTTKTTAAREEIEKTLDGLVHDGVMKDYKAANPTGNKLTWTLVFDHGDVHFDTAGVKAFLQGVALGRTVPATRPRLKRPDPIRDAIVATGRVEVPLPKDPAKEKSVRSGIFARAYQLGHKGAFTVTTDRERKVFVGEVQK